MTLSTRNIQSPQSFSILPRFVQDPNSDSRQMYADSGGPKETTTTNTILVSRTPTLSTLKDVSIPVPPFAELSAASEIQRALGHTRQKSSLSSLRKFLPKFLPFALPLSADPQIRALAEADCRRDIETQADGNILEQSPCASSISTLSEVTDSDARHSATQPTPARPRAASANSTDAPEVLVPAPVHVRRSNTAHTAPVSRPTSRSHRSSYMLIPPNQIARRPLNRAPSRRVSPIEPDTVPTHTQPSSRRRSEIYHFDPVQIPRHTQSQNNRPQRRFEQYRNISPNWRRNDVEILYPSTRRPRSSTCGGIGPAGHLDSIRETGTSVDEARVPNSEKMGRGNILDRNTYRGANRTSMHGFS
ncbi:uncharacterized protein ACLA_001320 [Aspergillus clavatus NRRL 1]|uniref:Uncharacterized protein n=1 Tax=Aspergillus clavatus (strain ATCC 1007 / CBS 513.65 / DSM 816 / NCTC 3887 / NRRL 1 / QM 1276 / 107) TaxID=344612 RepID=A1C4V3_ASPCL|nr:uncharacterized protein ACLA_001320 [Aspergillus clavatus NRRL 1]EAW14721.1 conserved hypothetical protein [Aspergillus clavatus NRRL 1]